MPAITYADFSGGLDRRLPVTVQDSSRLWILRNARITDGKRIAKRPGLRVISTGLAGSVGLAAAAGRLKVFCTATSHFYPPTQVDRVSLNYPSDLDGTHDLQRIYSAQVFNGFLYVVADYEPGPVFSGAISEGNLGGDNAGRVPPPRDPQPGDPGTA